MNTAIGAGLATVPNLISALRLPIAAAFLVSDELLWRGFLLFLGGASDLLDGWLARRLRIESASGALIDPLFDKLFVLIALAAFLPGPHLSWGDFAILIARDLYVGLAFLVANSVGIQVPARSRPTGKLVTFLQVVTLFVLLFAPDQTTLFVAVVAAASVIAIIDYTAAGIAAARRRTSQA